jgi:TetR/AcrR family transcriptional repressor of nem operon
MAPRNTSQILDTTPRAGASDKRERLLRAAEQLFHHKGFEHTSLADIASASGVPVGNVYYYFKTRDDLARSVSEERRRVMHERRVEWEKLKTPRDRLLAYVDSFIAREAEFTAYGCPVGSLCLETSKLGGQLASDASAVLRDSLEWLEKQFRALGNNGRLAKENAARLLGARQGSVLLAATFQDPIFIRQELARLKKWLADMPAKPKGKSL